MAGSRTNGCLKTDRLEIGSDMFGCCTALVLVGRISGNRSDPQQLEQSSHALINILVDAVEHRLESFHEGTPCERVRGYQRRPGLKRSLNAALALPERLYLTVRKAELSLPMSANWQVWRGDAEGRHRDGGKAGAEESRRGQRPDIRNDGLCAVSGA